MIGHQLYRAEYAICRASVEMVATLGPRILPGGLIIQHHQSSLEHLGKT